MLARGSRGAVFAFVIICFTLPFVTVSCPGGRFTFSGLQVATGTTIQEQQMFGPPTTRELSAEPMATLALACAVIGALFVFATGRGVQIASSVVSVGGAVFLLLLRSRLDTEAQQQALNLMQTQYEVGYWGGLLFFCVGGLLSFVTREGLPPAPATRPQPTEVAAVVGAHQRPSSPTDAAAIGAQSAARFCAKCGARATAGGRFCASCGATLTAYHA